MFQFIVQAADSGENPLVTCSGLDCSVCSLVKMVVNIIYYLTWYISFPLAVLFLVIGGFIYIGARGNESWMALAKKAILWAVGGFAIVLLAFLTISSSLKIIGAKNNSVWSQVECSVDSSARLQDIPNKKATDLVKAMKKGGILSGKIAFQKDSTDEILTVMGNLDPTDMMVLESEISQTKKPLFILGKDKEKQTELLYLDRETINRVLGVINGKTTFVFNEANAKETGTASDSNSNKNDNTADDKNTNEILAEMSQIVTRIIDKRQNLIMVIAERPKGNNLGVNRMLEAVGNINQCLESKGSWYRFSEICKAEQENCSARKCVPSGNFNPVTACECLENSCLSNGVCVPKPGKK